MPRRSNLVCGRDSGRGANPGTVLASRRSRPERREHLLGVIRPVGRDVQVAAGREPERERVHEIRLEQPALVVALLRPRIREEHVDAGEGAHRNHRIDHLDRVVTDHAHVGEPAPVDLAEQAADAGRMHLDADEVPFRMCRGNLCRRLAHAEADLQHHRRGTAEHLLPVERCTRERKAVARQEFVERALLRRRHPPLPQHEAAHGAAGVLRPGDRRIRIAVGAHLPPTRLQPGSVSLRSSVLPVSAPSTV